MKRIFPLVFIAFLLVACGRFEGILTFLHEPPKAELIPGTYILDSKQYSYSSLNDEGYTDRSATLVLKPDGTFTASRVPDCCIYGLYGFFGGYFDGTGTWSVEKISAVFHIKFQFKKLQRDGPTKIKQPQTYDSVSFTLTRETKAYGLAAPLFEGEFQYAYFRKNY